ncbi:glycosyltransferase family 2 protein [Pseudoclavibacter sp. CFCC 14310]|nr:glycosyltransferase family 2 protein [Pseudoclavibacter sp. CFCC 14310]
MSKTTGTETNTKWETVQKTVFPIDVDPLVEPLYVAWGEALSGSGTQTQDAERLSGLRRATDSGSVAVGAKVKDGNPQLADRARYSALLPVGQRVSFATFFNAFPAAYWVQWTDVPAVQLKIVVSGDIRIDVYRSTSRGTFNRIGGALSAQGETTFELPLKNFGDGGWLWYELVANEPDSKLIEAEWQVDSSCRRLDHPGTFAASITTYNRPDDCVTQMQRFASETSLHDRLTRLTIVDQGTDLVQEASGYDAAQKALGDQFALIRQGNLGGSGGFARGMYEGERSKADYVILLDDDILIEPAAVLRAVAFADYCRKPTLVGGHMLNLYEKSKVQNFGEYVKEYPFRYGPVNEDLVDFDFAQNDLRTTPGLHRRIDVGYNGWWMCLIPTDVIREIGLSLPVFIKWDDVEYGVRADRQGFSTVTLPGVGVWHMPFVEKDDRLDWQAYFHQRNRWVAAMVYSRYKHGGSLPAESFATDVKHLLAQQYSAVALRILALQDLLKGPQHLHETIGHRAADARKLRQKYSDGQLIKHVSDYPEVSQDRPARRGRTAGDPKNRMEWLSMAGSAMLKNLVKGKPSTSHPESRISAADAKWWRIAASDSSLVSASDGNGASVYRRDPETFRRLFALSVKLHRELVGRWDELSEQYAREHHAFTSVQAWEETFERNAVTDPGHKQK